MIIESKVSSKNFNIQFFLAFNGKILKKNFSIFDTIFGSEKQFRCDKN